MHARKIRLLHAVCNEHCVSLVDVGNSTRQPILHCHAMMHFHIAYTRNFILGYGFLLFCCCFIFIFLVYFAFCFNRKRASPGPTWMIWILNDLWIVELARRQLATERHSQVLHGHFINGIYIWFSGMFIIYKSYYKYI